MTKSVHYFPPSSAPQLTARSHQPTIARQHQLGIDLTFVRRCGLNELHITLQPAPEENPSAMLLRLDAILREYKATVVRMEIFGSCASRPSFLKLMRRMMGRISWPLMWIDGAGPAGEPVAGLHVMAVHGANVKSLQIDGRVVGTMFTDASARHCILGDILPTHLHGARAKQAREVYENIERALHLAKMEPHNLARTWLYLDDLLSWYDDLNRVRTEIFREWNLFAAGVPASTGIGAKNPHGAAMIAGAWATVPHNAAAAVKEVVSPLQCPAGSYGSSFARAMEWTTPGHRRLTVSGTASIEPGGASAHLGDLLSQVDLTMDVVEAILDSRGATFADVTRATAYIKHPEHASALDDWFERSGAPWFPAIATHTQVCRDELLFEIELDTIIATPGGHLAK